MVDSEKVIKEESYNTNCYEEVCDDGTVIVSHCNPTISEIEIRHEDRISGLRSLEYARFRIPKERIRQIGEFITYVATKEGV